MLGLDPRRAVTGRHFSRSEPLLSGCAHLGLLRPMLAGLVIFASIIGTFLTASPAHAVPNTGTGGVFVPASGRLLDTRVSPNTAMTAGTWRTIQIAGQSGLPADGIGAVVLAAAAVNMTGQGHLYGRPDDSADSTLIMIYDGGGLGTTENAASLAVAADGTIQIETTTTADVVLDLEGYYTSNEDGTAPGGFVPVAGTRIVDSRTGLGVPHATIGSDQSVTVQVAGNAGIPADASGIAANFIAISSDINGYITPYAAGSPKPTRSLNYPGGVVTSLTAQVALSSDGKLTVSNHGGIIDLVIDIQGYFTSAPGGGALFTPASGRLYDTRVSPNSAVGANSVRAIPIAGVSGMPTMGSGMIAVVVVLTAIKSTSDHENTTVWADGAPEPETTGINSTDATIRTNTITVPLGANGKIDLANNSASPTDYVIDLEGWYINPVAPTITCPQPYSAGRWTTGVPSTPISCNVHMPNTGDSSGTLDVSVNGDDPVETMLSASAATDYSLSVPAVAGWYDIDAASNYAGDVGGDTHYEFGLNNGTPSVLTAAVEAANPEGFENLAGDATATAAVAGQVSAGDQVDGTATAADDATTGVTITSSAQTSTDPDTGDTTTIPASTVGLQLPFASTASSAQTESPGIVSYDNGNGSATLAVLKRDTSVQVNTIITNATAPTSYSYRLSLPAGSSPTLDADGSVSITDSADNLIGGISPAWARDANGVSVPTHYILNGTTLTQVVDTSGVHAYPVVADPWLGKALIKKTVWSYAYKSDPRLKVYPTTWGRVFSGPALWNRQWSEVIAKTTSYKARANTTDMKEQFECHLSLAAELWKSSYNLDTVLHRTSLAAYISHKCN